ncbi:DNA starvation/stationary phase protection protein [Alloprevotella tannerae]|uniref:Dps family protein n=1 Tax=Alloprevotella tannerae TaxID=76122 RepID=UPI001EDB2207|nr:DNA starvation/stationary phase protection protein [Alloprevotella tannerae]MCG2653536.1 DNA starvation/stationary phase protection protein [Alloprevotella tannerae]
MKTLDYLHLDEKKVESVVAALKQLLADYQIFYTNLRGFHWNVKGKGFFTLHAKYEELYNDAAEKIDEIAERILQLGYTPENRFSEYLKTSNIKEDGNLPLKGKDGLRRVLENLGDLIAQERKIVDLAGEYSDEATVALMDDFLVGQEKNVWMLVSFLGKQPEDDQL